MDLEKETKKFAKKYEECKSIVVKWEIAFSKENSRQPKRDDFCLAPRSVRLAYRTYLEIKHLLSTLAASNGGLAKGFEHLKKRKPIESPGKIFRRYSSFDGRSKGVPTPPPPKWTNPTMDGITPLSPPTEKIKPVPLHPETQASLPYFRNCFTPRPKKKSNENESGLPFGKLTSKLFIKEFETEPLPPIPTGNLENGLAQVEQEDSDFPIEIEKILMDVRRAVESFDKEDFDDDGASRSGDPGLNGTLTDALDSNISNFVFVPLSLPTVTHAAPETDTPHCANPQEHSFFTKRSSLKPRVVNNGWIDRCNFIAGENDLHQSEMLSSTTADETTKEGESTSLDREVNGHVNAPSIASVGNLQNTSIPLTIPNRIPPLISFEPIRDSVPMSQKENTELVPKLGSKKVRGKKSIEAKVSDGPTRKKPSKKVKKPAEPKVAAPKRKADEITDFDFLDEAAGNSGQTKGRKRIRLARRPTREKKINDNFVRVDVTKKVFVRGRKKMTGFQHKILDWKMKKVQAASEARIQLIKCKKCGEVGHFAKFCVKDLQKQNELTPDEVDDSPFPSLEEVTHMIWSKKASEACQTRTCIYDDSQPVEMETGQGSGEIGTEALSPNSNGSEDDEDTPRLVLVSHDDDSEADKSFCSESQPLDTDTTGEMNQSASSDSNSFVLNETGISSQPLAQVNSLSTPAFSNATLGPEDEGLLQEALQLFGYQDFRSGQKEAIIRVLLGHTTLVVLSTGSGKSLCYLLPAYIYAKKYPGVLTICVSPLVSLMEDQLQSIPPFLEGACLHTNMSLKARELVIEKIRKKKLDVLLVSPEAICGGLFGLLRNVHELPTIAFACVDEVHCVSEWSHNFRPSYLRVCQILRERLNVKTILGLTATATMHTIRSVCDHLCIDPSTVVSGEIMPSNLRLSCSRDIIREDALIMLLRSKRFEDCDSIIIYCTRREQCERIATLIRTTLNTQFSAIIKENSRRRISTDCETYHAGMSAARRKSVQKNFMAGKIRIVVATVAFGMGIDKSDIRAVIHYNMPKTFESFVQEIGRAGRDGLPAECHLFLDNNKGNDISELKRHIYSNSVDRSTLRKLLSRIFKSCNCQRPVKTKGSSNGGGTGGEVKVDVEKSCPGHEVSFSVDTTVRDVDLPDENIQTLLCYLERYSTEKKLIEVLPKCYHLCSIQSYGGTNLLKSSARNCAALAAAIAMQKEKKKFKDDDVHVSFNFVEVAKHFGWSSAQMRKELKSLEWTGTQFDESGNPTRFRKSGLLIEFSDLAYRLMAPGTLSDEESDKILNFLHERNLDQERMELFQLNRVYQSLFSNSCKSVESVCESYDEPKSDNLKKLILEYFSNSDVGVPVGWKPPISGNNAEKEEIIRQDVRKLLASCRDHEFSSRSIARIFQGISSPCFPADDWCRNRAFWRRHLDVDFPFLCQIAAQELIS